MIKTAIITLLTAPGKIAFEKGFAAKHTVPRLFGKDNGFNPDYYAVAGSFQDKGTTVIR